MKAWIKDGKPVFFPIKGAVPAGDAVETVDAYDATTHEPGPVLGVSIVDGTVTVRRQAKPKDGKKLAREKLAKDVKTADTIPKLQKLVEDLITLI